MRIILDTNIVSELMRSPAKRNASVVAWFSDLAYADILLNRITDAEILAGSHGHPDAVQGRRLRDAWLSIKSRFEMLEFDAGATKAAARFRGERKRQGYAVSFADAAIAGIARDAGAALATRNIADFEGAEIRLINPFLSK